MNEFDLIYHYLQPQAGQRPDVVLGIGDDCALLTPPAGQCLVSTTDTLVENIHFTADTPIQAIGHKCLAVSLSDLAAMGAEPAWVLLSLTLPTGDPSWLEAFTQGFFPLLQQHHLQLAGGNTSRGPLTITTQLLGFVPANMALLRSGAKLGDRIYLSGHLGDAGLALRCLQNHLSLPANQLQSIRQRLDFPQPRIKMGLALRGLAHSAIDISDGLLADLTHILTASQVGATLKIDRLPLSPILSTVSRPLAEDLAMTAGDDYELCFTVAADRDQELQQICRNLKLDCHYIGDIEQTPGLRLIRNNGEAVQFTNMGYNHFWGLPPSPHPPSPTSERG